MPEYKPHTETIEVPKNTGRKGFLHVIDKILQLDRVQEINIDARGNVTYSRFLREDFAPEAVDIGPKISFETLMPYACVRNGTVEEITVGERHPSPAVAKMFQRVSNARLYPVAFICGANTTLWDWFKICENLEVENREEFYGLPLLPDRHVEDYVLILAAAYGRSADITEAQKSFKITMPQRRDDALDSRSGNQSGAAPQGNPGRVPPLGLSGGGTNGTPPNPRGGGSRTGGGSSG